MNHLLLNLLLSPWTLFGFFAQFIFFLRFAIQMFVSEKRKESYIPVSFWYLSLIGSALILIYSIHIKDIVFTVANSIQSVIYIRNLVLIRKTKAKTL